MTRYTGTISGAKGMSVPSDTVSDSRYAPPPVNVGTPIVAVPYDEWPPAFPQPNTLYLRLAP